MSCNKCQNYFPDNSRRAKLSAIPEELEEVFDIEITHAGSCWCEGNGICKSCQQNIKFDFENFIYNKLHIQML
ncbi:MAG: hypothetical protein ACJAWV_000381 [Flammeovirgaceae bacterium]|jgi:hypothetical protein